MCTRQPTVATCVRVLSMQGWQGVWLLPASVKVGGWMTFVECFELQSVEQIEPKGMANTLRKVMGRHSRHSGTVFCGHVFLEHVSKTKARDDSIDKELS